MTRAACACACQLECQKPRQVVKDQPQPERSQPRHRTHPHGVHTFHSLVDTLFRIFLLRAICLTTAIERSDHPIRTPANPANSLRQAGTAFPSFDVGSASDLHATAARPQRQVAGARRCGEETHFQKCLRHHHQSPGKRAEAQRVPRLVSGWRGNLRRSPLTRPQASLVRAHQQQQQHRRAQHRLSHQYQTPSAQ